MKQILASLLCLASFVAANIVDLSQPWSLAGNYNQNELYCVLQPQVRDQIMGYVVIRDGLIVAEDYRANNRPDDLVAVYSATKSWTSLLVGLLVDAGQLELNTTLGDVWEDDAVWNDIVNAEDKKNLTVFELLTFTSGLREIDPVLGIFAQNSLTDTLNQTTWLAAERGNYEYLPSNHILAQIIYQVSGLTPLEVANSDVYGNVFAALGMQLNIDYRWDAFGNVQGSAFGMHMNPRILAKLGQLYVQQGVAQPNAAPIVSPAWVAASTTNQLPTGVVPENNPPIQGYGYQWYVSSSEVDENFSAVGAGGQLLYVYPNDDTVVALMTTFTNEAEAQQSTLQAFTLMATIEQNLAAMDQDGSCVASVAPSTTTAAPSTSAAASGWSIGSTVAAIVLGLSMVL